MPESMAASSTLWSALRVMSFVLETPIAAAKVLGGESLIPESQADEECIRKLDSLAPFEELGCRLSIQAPKFQGLDAGTLDKLLSREVGLAIYSDALHLSRPIGRFRELWRVLESAFGQKNYELVESLSKYPPAVKLDFDTSELTELSVLRGRASHAESSTGLQEYQLVSNRVECFLPRLESLVVEVLLTKKTWGSKGLLVERLAPLRTYVRKDGVPVLFK